jgi:hypothetical protein
MDDILEALLSREAVPNGTGICEHCDNNVCAVWRCKDCVLGTTMCRACMRNAHRENPFHRIEQWNGTYFRPAELWEVGTYLLVRHHRGDPLCDDLRALCDFLETTENTKDHAEEEQLRKLMQECKQGPLGPVPVKEPYFDDYFDMEDEGETVEGGGEDNDDAEESDRDEAVESRIENPYLDNDTPACGIPGTYVRVVHCNGLHHIAMISCTCRGGDDPSLDLIAAQLLPASFKRIKTLFTAQVLDMYRLSNLELKASAYQFYQLLRRLTKPMAPAEVINLYREFRRMSRIWRWMKKLKWAGRVGNVAPVSAVGAGELAIYCPACPQPGINIPDDWKDDTARHVSPLCIDIILMAVLRWVYKRIFVADGNFKADHVRQKNAAGDVWLCEGTGMMPHNDDYMAFLASAIERLTVSDQYLPGCRCYAGDAGHHR